MSSVNPASRPAAVTLIGWVWIVLAALSLGGSLIGFAVRRLVDDVSISIRQRGPVDLPGAFESFAWVLEHYSLILTLQLATAAAILFVAVSFLRRRSWARPALVAVHYLSIAALLAKTAWWWTLIPSVAGGPGMVQPFEAVARALTVLLVAFYVVPLVVMLCFLHGARVRQSFEHSPQRAVQAPPSSS
jgi:hypothetical protein